MSGLGGNITMKIALKILGWIAGLVLFVVAAFAIYLYATAFKPSRPVGYQQAAAPDPGNKRIGLAIWYPTDAKPGFVLLGTSGQRVASQGPVIGRNLPLIVISHGTGGTAVGHADTAIALAEAGFVVAAPMHPGDNLEDDSAVGTSRWLVDRARHVSRVIDFMQGEWKDRAHLDLSRVGVFGLSAGGTTALIGIGGTPALERVASHCADHPEFVCKLMRPGTVLRNPPPPGWQRDPRIAAAVVVAPGLGFTFEPAGLSTVTAPVQLWVGSEDKIVPYATNAGLVRKLLPTAPEFHSVPGAVHVSFLMPCGIIGPPAPCRDEPGFDRAAFHKDFNRSVVAFFSQKLAPRAPSPVGDKP